MKYYANKTGIKLPKKIPSNLMRDFSGADVESLIHIANMRKMSLENAAKCIIPQAKTMAENINALRQWAEGRTIPAENIPISGEKTKRQLDIQ